MISYEGSKWYIKTWRKRWYIYAILLHAKNFININLWLEMLLNKKLEGKTKKQLRKNWRDIKYHVELSKMYKFSTKRKYEK